MKEEKKKIAVDITEKGSLGLLALGDIGIKAWREVKATAREKRKNEKEK